MAKTGIEKFVARVSGSYWTLERFGLSPNKLFGRIVGWGSARTVIVSFPKSGTHLLERAVCLVPGVHRRLVRTVNDKNLGECGGLDLIRKLKKGQVLVTHLTHTRERADVLASEGVNGILMIRDPRDVVVSQVFHIAGDPRHQAHPAYARRETFRDQLLLAIEGDAKDNRLSIGARLRQFEGWLNEDLTLVRFEDLVGSAGGGNDGDQATILGKLYGDMGVPDPEATARRTRRRLFSTSSPTFRKGRSGGWREHFDDELTERFNEIAGWALDRLGYER